VVGLAGRVELHTQTRATYGGLCGMPACGQAAGCGVCDTPELWRGAAGLCARVRACAGAAESLHTYIHTYVPTIRMLCNTEKKKKKKKNLLIPSAAVFFFSLDASSGLLATRRRLGRQGDSSAMRSAFVV